LGGDSAAQAALGWIGESVQQQASYLSYIDVFLVLSVLAAALAPLALTLRAVDLNRPSQGAP
jgi:DHA2 family multidrug resistance protein